MMHCVYRYVFLTQWSGHAKTNNKLRWPVPLGVHLCWVPVAHRWQISERFWPVCQPSPRPKSHKKIWSLRSVRIHVLALPSLRNVHLCRPWSESGSVTKLSWVCVCVCASKFFANKRSGLSQRSILTIDVPLILKIRDIIFIFPEIKFTKRICIGKCVKNTEKNPRKHESAGDFN